MNRVVGSWPVITSLLVLLTSVHGYRQIPSFFTSIRSRSSYDDHISSFSALYLQKSLFPETISAYGIDIPVPLSSRSSLKCEVDYLGMINFCLRKTDTALSGSSKSKMLNAVTNEVFRALMIAYEPSILALLDKFKFYESQLGGTNYCLMDDNNMISLVPPTAWSPGSSVAPGEGDITLINPSSSSSSSSPMTPTPYQRPDVYDMSECRACKMYLEALEGLLRTGAKRSQVPTYPLNAILSIIHPLTLYDNTPLYHTFVIHPNYTYSFNPLISTHISSNQHLS